MAEQIRGMADLARRLEAIKDNKAKLQYLQIKVTEAAKRNTRSIRKTGNLGRSIRPGFLSATEAFVKAEASYAAYVEKGTGIYGPRKRPIVPRRAKVLAWRTGAVTLSGRSRVKGGQELAGWAFAKSVRGRPATPFMAPAAEEVARNSGLAELTVKLWNEGA